MTILMTSFINCGIFHCLQRQHKNNIHTEEFNKSGSKKNSWTQAFAYLPCRLIGRLGVNKSFQGKGLKIGRQVVNFIKLWFLDDNNKTGCRFLVVDAYNKPEVLSFYEQNGFKYLYATEDDEKEATQSDSESLNTRLMFLDLLHTTIL